MVTRARDIYLTPDQRRRLLEQCKGAFRDLVEAALLTGARYGELRELRASDFDSWRKALTIRHGKTGARTVPLSDAARTLFARLCRNRLPAAYLFTRGDGQPWKHSDQDEPMREAARAAKLPKGTVFYTLRHTFIASAITGGMDIHSVAKITGTSVRMIEQHYGKLLQDDAGAPEPDRLRVTRNQRRKRSAIGPSARGITRRIEGRRHSRIEITSGPAEVLFKRFGRPNGKGHLRIGSEFAERVAAMRAAAGEILRRRGLPDVPRVFVTKGAPTTWQGYSPTADDLKSSCTVEHYVRQRGFGRDSREDLAARILVTVALMEANPTIGHEFAFELGRLWTLLRVYAAESAPGTKGGTLGAITKRQRAEAWQGKIRDDVRRHIVAGKSDSNIGVLLARAAGRAPRTVTAYAAAVRRDFKRKSAK